MTATLLSTAFSTTPEGLETFVGPETHDWYSGSGTAHVQPESESEITLPVDSNTLDQESALRFKILDLVKNSPGIDFEVIASRLDIPDLVAMELVDDLRMKGFIGPA